MKTPKLLKLSQEILSEDQNKRHKQKKSLKEIQQKLKKKGKKIQSKIAQEKNEKEIQKMQDDLKIIHAQRNKIIKFLKALK